jgi:hypothetical protein
MRVGWLSDAPTYTGGAELTQAEFRAAAPEGVEIVDCPAGAVQDCDRYVIHNCVRYTPGDFEPIKHRPAVKYWHDVGPWISQDVRAILDEHAQAVCCSPVQAEYMGLSDAVLIPPALDLQRFEEAASRVNGNRAGVVSVGQWRNFGKAAHRVAAWAMASDTNVDFFGDGAFAPDGSQPVAYQDMPGLLARYQVFVFLPMVIEPFGRTVAEAWAAGCEVVTNGLVGARYWITERPEALETAADDFWAVVLS